MLVFSLDQSLKALPQVNLSWQDDGEIAKVDLTNDCYVHEIAVLAIFKE